jgi:cell division protease FtsH
MNIFVSWFPMLLLIGVWIFFMRQMQGGGRGGAFSFGKSRARMLDENQNQVTFADVAGVDEAKEEVASWSTSCATRPSSRSWAGASRAAC